MGRSVPTLRVALEREIKRLLRVARAERDLEVRRTMEELASSGRVLLDAYLEEPPTDAMEIVLVSAIAGLFIRVSRLEALLKKRATFGEPGS